MAQMKPNSSMRQIDYQLLRPMRSWTVSSFHMDNKTRQAHHAKSTGLLGLHHDNNIRNDNSRLGKRTENPIVVLLFGDSTILARVFEYLNVVDHFTHRLVCSNLKRQLSNIAITFRTQGGPQGNEISLLCKHFSQSARLGRTFPFNALRGLFFNSQVTLENIEDLSVAMPSLYRLKVLKINTLESIASTSLFLNCLNDLGSSAKLRTLDMSGPLIGDEGAIQLAQIFSQGSLPSLKHLLLKRNMITDVGCKKLVISLQTKECLIQLKTIDCSINAITDDGASFLFKKLGHSGLSSIQNLILCNNKILSNSMQDLCLAIKSKQLNKWQTLQLANNELGNRTTESLFNCLENYGMHCQNICQINLSCCKIDDISIQSFAKVLEKGYFSDLVFLDMSMNEITVVGIKPLITALNKTNCRYLSHLNIAGNGILDVGINFLTSSLVLGHMRSLTYLDISYNGGVSCVSNLANAILKGCCPDLADLNITGNIPPYLNATQLFKNRVRVRIS